ncbi:MAG: circularly permuted type 2 ATP-grasp protein [Myxococcales bacterium]|nr:circularly permuted type 2 ATP-grasp protein [Myxococcales bacterium]
MLLSGYDARSTYDEMCKASGGPREGSEVLFRRLEALSSGELRSYQNAAMVTMRNLGITFNVYGHQDGTEKVWPLDIIPRVIAESEWNRVERGLAQRVRALNHFVDDIYHDQKILKDGVVPRELIETCEGYRPQCKGIDPPRGIWCHISGTDLVRDQKGTLYVLEDNMRVPSGVSYVLENRAVMKRAFPKVFDGQSVRPVEDYPERLLEMLIHCGPEGVTEPCVVVWTPGIYNSAYFEHSALARQMGVKLVQASDLVVHDGYVHMRTTRGLHRVDVIYRRIDDDFMDPRAFRQDSLLGVPGLMDVYRAGRVGLANAPGGGVGDDKAVYAYVPKIIKYYLAEEAVLDNVPTYLCSEPRECKYVLEHLDQLVVKPTNASGGKGIVLGPQASQQELEECHRRILADPRNYVAQPMLQLSTVPTLIGDSLEGRHVDLRPFVLYGDGIYVLPGGLTRVALKRGSMVVNSSQGGGSKDTWVIRGG